MRGPKPAYPIALSAEEVAHLQHLVRAHTTPQTLAVRARIILRAHDYPEESHQQVAAACGTTDRTVRTWRRRWVTTHQLADAPRSGAPRRFSPQVRAQVTAIACSLPKQSQVPLARWSRTELARHVAQDPSLPPLSTSTVGRWLKAERLHPWRYHSWQHIYDPVAFLQRARPVLEVYAQAQALLHTGTWLVSLDEKTSIQAREGEQPPRPARSGKPMLHEARYQRRGARHLFAGLSIADGKVYETCRERSVGLQSSLNFGAHLWTTLTYQDALRQDVVLRHPFSDRDLHEFCLSLGPHHRSRWYAGRILPKFLLRLAYVGDLPPDIISSEVRTPYASVSEQYCLHNREELSELFSSKSCLARLGILDSVAIEEILLDAGLIQKHSRSFVRMSGVEMWLRSLAREPLQGGKCSPTPATPLPAELVGVREQQAKRVGVLVPREGVLARTINVATIMVDTSTLEVCRLDEEGVHYWQALCSAPTWPRVFAQLQQTYPESDLNEIKNHARHFADLLVAQGWAVVNKKEEEEIDGICALDCNCI